MKERKWKSILAWTSFKGKPLSTAISKLVMRLVRHDDQDEREVDGAVHWNTISPKLMRAFGDKGARDFFRRRIGFNTIMKEVTRRVSSTARIPSIPDVHSCNSRTHCWGYDGA